MMKIEKELLGIYGLTLVALFWGLGFPALKVLSDNIPTFYMIGLRFLIATLFLAIFFHKRITSIDASLIRSALLLSFFLFLTYTFATIGIQYTTSAKASFFSCLGVLVIPLILWGFFHVKVGRRLGISVAMCTVGLFLISYTKDMGFGLSSGDIICLGCSVCGALHVIFTGKLAGDHDAALLTLVQLFFISVWGFLTGFVLEDFPTAISTFHFGILIFLAILCTAISFLLQTVCQRFISASRVGVIYAIEPVSGALFSAWLLGDQLGATGYIGGALIFASLICLESFKKPPVMLDR